MYDFTRLRSIIDGVRAIAGVVHDIATLPQAERDLAATKLDAVLDEIDKSCVGLEAQVVRLLTVDLGNQCEARATLVALEGGAVRAAMADVRGHCTRIDIIYQRHLDSIFQKLAPQRYGEIQRAFGALQGADSVMLDIIDKLSAFLAKKADEVLDLVDDGDLMAARVTLKLARKEVLELRLALSDLRYWLRTAQAGFLLTSAAL